MLAMIKRHPRAFILAVVVHVIFAVLMGMSLRIHDYTPSSKAKVSVVQAVAVDEKQVAKELKRIKSAEQQKQRKINNDIRRAQAQRRREERRLVALKAKQQEQRKQKLAEQKRLAQIKQQKQALEQQRQQEQAELAKARKQRAQEEKALQQMDKERKEAELKRQLADEQERLAQQNQQRQSTIDTYISMIQAAVRKHWQIPPGARSGMGCELRVRLLPSGEVVRVELLKSSGDPLFDKSVEVAVRKASPLPVPKVETGLFEVFRDLKFPFKLESKV